MKIPTSLEKMENNLLNPERLKLDAKFRQKLNEKIIFHSYFHWLIDNLGANCSFQINNKIIATPATNCSSYLLKNIS